MWLQGTLGSVLNVLRELPMLMRLLPPVKGKLRSKRTAIATAAADEVATWQGHACTASTHAISTCRCAAPSATRTVAFRPTELGASLLYTFVVGR